VSFGANRWIAFWLGTIGVLLGLGGVARAQDRGGLGGRDGAGGYRAGDSSDLVRENLQRVAASAVQIKGVLIRDPGLLVELKNWVAKEAGDNGQIVEDSEVSDTGIFERLDQDLAFRSVATRLLRRYGYLLPGLNPDSEAAKEQELVLRERVRRQVQAEQEQDALAQREGAEKLAKIPECYSQNDTRCGGSGGAAGPARKSRRQAAPSPEIEPNLPILPDSISPTDLARTLRAASSSGGEGGAASTVGGDGNFSLASSPMGRGDDGGSSLRAGMGGVGAGHNSLLDLFPISTGVDPGRGAASGGKEPKIVRLPG